MKRKEKIILGLLVATATSLSVAAIIGASFCSYSLILLVPALVPVAAYGFYKLTKLNLTKKVKNLNN